MAEKKMAPIAEIKVQPSLEVNDKQFKMYAALVYKLTGILITENKRALLNNRLDKRLRARQIKNYDSYYEILTGGKDETEVRRFIDSITTNETYFFRAPKIWEFFSGQFLPQWYAETGAKKTLQIWCAASSSGEEPYTIGILCEEFARKNPSFKWQMRASDISEDMLARCNEAVYSGRSIEKVDPKILEKYFDKKNSEDYAVKNLVKQKIQFFRYNLLENSKFTSEFDIVLLRNVMIYFDGPTKEGILTRMAKSLKSKGTLVVGESEGLIGVKAPFDFIAPSIFRRKD